MGTKKEKKNRVLATYGLKATKVGKYSALYSHFSKVFALVLDNVSVRKKKYLKK